MAYPASYYPMVCFNQRYLRGDFQSATEKRAGDFLILSRQRPLGWSFFSHANVDRLLRTCSEVHPDVSFDHIMEDMLFVYEGNGAETHVRAGSEALLVEKLNEMFIERWANGVNRKINNMRRYQDILAQPNPIMPRPQNPSQRDASLVMYERDLAHFADAQGSFITSAQSRVVPRDAAEKKFYIPTLESDYY
jgi:hypothetical protein